MPARIEHLITAGTFDLDGGTWELENNVWIVGDDTECIVIDAAHDADAILAAVGDRTLLGILSTHAHNDHIGAARAVAAATGAPVYLHPDDRMLWDVVYPDAAPDRDLEHDQRITVAGTPLQVISTPGHSPGSVCLYAPSFGTLFSGDTLFHGGPGATGRSYSDKPTILNSIQERLLTLPGETVVKTGHGDDTVVADEVDNIH